MTFVVSLAIFGSSPLTGPATSSEHVQRLEAKPKPSPTKLNYHTCHSSKFLRSSNSL